MFNLNKIWFRVFDQLMGIIDTLNTVFYWFAGVLPTNTTDVSSVGNVGAGEFVNSVQEDNLLYEVFTNGKIARLFWFFVVIGIACLGLALAIGLLKTSFGDDQAKSKKKLLGKSTLSIFQIIAMPLIFLTVIICVNAIINLIVQACVGTLGADNQTLGSMIGNMCFNGKPVAKYRVGMSWSEFKGACPEGDDDNFLYLVGILAGGCTVVGLFMSVLNVIERMIHILFLYIVSPLAISKTPLDDGKGMEQWKETCFSKFLGVSGVIVCMYLFFMIVPTVLEKFNSSGYTYTIAKLCFIISGAFVFSKAGTLFAHLVSSAQGQFEGMSMGTSMGLLRMGAGLAKGAMNKGLAGARSGLVGGGKNAVAGAKSGLAGGGNNGASTFGASQNLNALNSASPMTQAMAGANAGAGAIGGKGGNGAGFLTRAGISDGFVRGGLIGAGFAGAVAGVKGITKGLGKFGKWGTKKLWNNPFGKGGLSAKERLSLRKAKHFSDKGKLGKQKAKAKAKSIKMKDLQNRRMTAYRDRMGKGFNTRNHLDNNHISNVNSIRNRYKAPIKPRKPISNNGSTNA